LYALYSLIACNSGGGGDGVEIIVELFEQYTKSWMH
jgi:hypothetical protein